VSSWLEICRLCVEDVRGVLAQLPTRAEREPVLRRGEGGDDTTAIDQAAEDAIIARLAQARPQEEELAIRIAGGGDALVECGVGPGEIALAGEEAEERAVRLGQGGGLGDQRPVAGLGLVGPAFDRVEAGEEEAGREALRIGGECRLDGATGLVRLAGGETGADETGEGLAPGIDSGIAARAGAAEGEGLEHRRCCGWLAFAAETGGVEARRHCR